MLRTKEENAFQQLHLISKYITLLIFQQEFVAEFCHFHILSPVKYTPYNNHSHFNSSLLISCYLERTTISSYVLSILGIESHTQESGPFFLCTNRGSQWDEWLAIFSPKHCRNLKVFHSRLFTSKQHDLPTNHTKVLSTYSNFTRLIILDFSILDFSCLKKMTCQLNKPQRIRCPIPLSPITSNKCLIFHTKEAMTDQNGLYSYLDLFHVQDLKVNAWRIRVEHLI